MNQHRLGEFEEVVLLTVAILNGEAYGVSIIERIETELNRKASIGAVQTVLKRLESKEMVSSQFGEASNVRGGKRKRVYSITALGVRVLKENKDQRDALWNAIPTMAY